jgi:electron transfer flavoprotein beta subunit
VPCAIRRSKAGLGNVHRTLRNGVTDSRMHVVVCVKRIPDPEAPWVQFSIDDVARAVVPLPGVRWFMSPFDEQALEAAMRLREATAEVRITVLTLGHEASRATLKHGLAMGADDGVLLCDPAFEDGDAWSVSAAIVAALRKLDGPSLVLTGRQSADWDGGSVGSIVGESLNWPVVTYAQAIELSGGEIRVERVVEDGIDIVQAPLPAVVTVSNELGKPRVPNLRETMRAMRKPVVTWNAAELGLDAGQLGTRSHCERLYAPQRTLVCEFMGGNTAREQAVLLATRLREASLV